MSNESNWTPIDLAIDLQELLRENAGDNEGRFLFRTVAEPNGPFAKGQKVYGSVTVKMHDGSEFLIEISAKNPGEKVLG